MKKCERCALPLVNATARKRFCNDKCRRGFNYTGNESEYRRTRTLKAKGLTPDQFDAMLAAQGNACAACGTTDPGGTGQWHVDHDHRCCPGQKTCGECTTALLCMKCNTTEGKHTVEELTALLAYKIMKEGAMVGNKAV